MHDLFQDPDNLPMTSLQTHPGVVTVCDTKYKCTGSTETGFLWEATNEKAPVGKAGCLSDSLAAIAASNHCYNVMTREDLPPLCLREEACMVVEGAEPDCEGAPDTDRLRCVKKNDKSGSMPRAVPASWRCVATRPHRTDPNLRYEVVGETNMADVSVLSLSRVFPEGSTAHEELQAKRSADAVRDATAAAEAERVALSTAAEAARQKEEEARSNAAATGGSPEAEQAVEAAAEVANAAEAASNAANAAEAARPKACDWFQRKSQLACSTDLDCPMAVFDAWFGAAVDAVLPVRSKMRVNQFVRDSLETDMMTAGSYETIPVPSGVNGDTSRLDRRQMRERMREAFLADRPFRDSITRIVRNEAAKGRTSIPTGTGGYCTASRVCGGEKTEPVRISSHLFDGAEEIAFTEGDDGSVFYRSTLKYGATQHPLQVTSCNATNRPAECDTLEAASLERMGQGTLVLRKGATPKEMFKLSFPETGGEYIFRNRVTTQKSGNEGRASCAQALCTLRAEDCPGTYCKREGEGPLSACVPRAELVADVRLL